MNKKVETILTNYEKYIAEQKNIPNVQLVKNDTDKQTGEIFVTKETEIIKPKKKYSEEEKEKGLFIVDKVPTVEKIDKKGSFLDKLKNIQYSE